MKSRELKEGLKNFYKRREDINSTFGPHSFTPGLKPTYWASSYPAMLYSLIGILNEFSYEDINSWLTYLQSGQNEITGFFNEPINSDNQPSGGTHKAEDILWHGATFIIGAIHVLGGKPIHPFSIINKYKKPGKMEEWLEGLDWTNPWKVGNWTYDMGCIIGSDYEITGDKKNLKTINEFFYWHDTNTDNESGWWNPSGEAPLYMQQFGGYHSLMVYWMFGREVPDPEKMIMSSLSLQSENGSYMEHGCCGDMDVIDTVVSLSRQYDICHKEVKVSVEKFYPYLMKLWDNSGGFMGLPNALHIDLGWKLHEGKVGKADSCSTYFRTFTLSLVNEILELDWLSDINWKHMDGFAHGRRPDKLL